MSNKQHEKDEPLSFVMFLNDSDNPTAPQYVGKIVLADGTLMRLAGWKKDFVKDGESRHLIGGKMSEYLSKEEYEAKFGNKRQKSEPANATADDNDDLPF
jgi:hypothetical protein